MRKLYIAIAVIMLLALLVPTSLVSAVDTTVTVGGGGDPPVVKCKWEQQNSFQPSKTVTRYMRHPDSRSFRPEPRAQRRRLSTSR